MTPYKVQFIFHDLRMTLDSGRDLAENGTLQKITPYEAEFIFLDLRMGNRARSNIPRNGAKIVRLTKNNPLRSGIYFP